jgi:hypothetical protein
MTSFSWSSIELQESLIQNSKVSEIHGKLMSRAPSQFSCSLCIHFSKVLFVTSFFAAKGTAMTMSDEPRSVETRNFSHITGKC